MNPSLLAALVPALVPMVPEWLQPDKIIQMAGPAALWVVALIVFAECGLAIFFMPGDSLLFAVGMFCAVGINSATPLIHYGNPAATLTLVITVLTIAAIAGNVCGYWIGRAVGPALFREREGFMGKIFAPKHIDQTHDFFDRYGAKALVLARFVPIVRTFVTMVAGVGRFEFKRFIAWTALGGVLWAAIAVLAGYFLGQIPVVKKNFELAMILIIVISLIPMLIEYLNQRRKGKAAAATAAEQAGDERL